MKNEFEEIQSADFEFSNYTRVSSNENNTSNFIIDTFKPCLTKAQITPYINVIIFARGLLNHLYTRIYFSDEWKNNIQDPFFKKVNKKRRCTLIANLSKKSKNITYYKFDIILSGENETVFIDI